MATQKDDDKAKNDENLLTPSGQGPLLWFALILIPVLLAIYMTLSSGQSVDSSAAAVAAPAVKVQPPKGPGREYSGIALSRGTPRGAKKE